MLRPHRNLEELTIKGYRGIEFPSWFGNSIFSNMVVLRLENCEKCTSLSSLGRLSSLKELTIKGMKGLKTISYELYGEGCSKPFQLLETLCFEDLQEWELWEPIKDNENVETFPCLRKLSIVKCPRLSRKLPDDLSSLLELVIKECAELVVSFSSLSLLCKLEIDGCDRIACNSQVDFKSLESMTLSNISEYGKWFSQQFEKDSCLQKEPQQLQSFTLLRGLCIENCSNLVSFHEVCFLSNLTTLEIRNCNALTSLPEGMKHDNACLSDLIIKHCSSLTFIIKGQPPPSLRQLDVKNCEKLECLFDDKDESCASSMPHKENTNSRSTSLLVNSPSFTCLSSRGQFPGENLRLEIDGCSQLTTIFSSGQLPKRLYSLHILNAPKLESIAERLHDNTNLESILIAHCDNLKYMPEGLDNLSCLQHFRVWNCPNLVCFPGGGLPNLITLIIEDAHIESFPEKGFPTNLIKLCIGYKTLVEWGLHKFTSLTWLRIRDWPDAESFPQEELGMQLPPTLINLDIIRFPNLKYLSSKGFQNLTRLECLHIGDCPNLTSFPKQGLPSSLLRLIIRKCPLLKEECKRNIGKKWSKISHISCIEIDFRNIYGPEEED